MKSLYQLFIFVFQEMRCSRTSTKSKCLRMAWWSKLKERYSNPVLHFYTLSPSLKWMSQVFDSLFSESYESDSRADHPPCPEPGFTSRDAFEKTLKSSLRRLFYFLEVFVRKWSLWYAVRDTSCWFGLKTPAVRRSPFADIAWGSRCYCLYSNEGLLKKMAVWVVLE